MNIDIQFSLAQDKAAVKRFYKAQHYPGKYKGYDQVFIGEQMGNIIATAMFSQLNVENKQALMHGVVVNKASHKQGIASKLIRYALPQLGSGITEVVCFSAPNLSALYLPLGFKQVNENSLNDLLLKRYQAYQKHQADLAIFSTQLR